MVIHSYQLKFECGRYMIWSLHTLYIALLSSECDGIRRFVLNHAQSHQASSRRACPRRLLFVSRMKYARK